jgi:choline-phosphate cytidylyltransferase
MELRDSVRNNWTTTGQELTKELRQFWQQSRPPSPARALSRTGSEVDLKSPTALAHLAHLDIPGRQESPNGRGASSDFATGYSLGLIGGVRSWVSSELLSQCLTGAKYR